MISEKYLKIILPALSRLKINWKNKSSPENDLTGIKELFPIYFTNMEMALNSGAAEERVSSKSIDSEEVIMIPS